MKTVRVRIAVAVESDGHWYAVGCSHWSESNTRHSADAMQHNSEPFWIEADLPIPEIQTVEGEVKEGK